MTFDDVPGEFFVSTDKALLNVPWIVAELNRTYWGDWMKLSTVVTAIEHSLCFGLYRRGSPNEQPVQIGFARVVTDYATFAWLCDVIVSKEYRGKGLGKFLVYTATNHPQVKPRSVLLCTRDAHKLYAKFGFHSMEAMKRNGGE